MTKKEEIEVLMIFPVPGKWTIETEHGGGFILTSETDKEATFTCKTGEIQKWAIGKR